MFWREIRSAGRYENHPLIRTKPDPTMTFLRSHIAVLLFICLGTISAQENEITVKFHRKPDRNWTHYKKIAIGEFIGQDGTPTPRSADISDYVANVFTKAGEFKVYDRNQLAMIMKEQKIQMSGTFDQESTIQAGKLVGSDFMILGRVQQDDFWQGGENMVVPGFGKFHSSKGSYILAVSFNIIDPQTGETIESFVEHVQIDKNRLKFRYSAMDYNDAEMQRIALEQLAERFSRKLAPYVLEETIKLKGDPAFNSQMKLGIRHFELDEADEAVSIFKTICEDQGLKASAQHKAKYNYGLILLCQGQCDQAVPLFRDAYMANGKMADYLDAFNKAKEQCAQEAKAH